MTDIDAVRDYLTGLQDRICAALEALDGSARFAEDRVARPEGGGGRTRVLRDGARVRAGRRRIFGCVRARRCRLGQRARDRNWPARSWRALGVSLVLHPRNPYVPTTHANVRHFQRDARRRDRSVVVRRRLRPDAVLSVRRGRAALAPRRARAVRAVRRGASTPRYKRWCDEYFFLQAPRRDARRRRPVLRRPARRRFRAALRVTCARSATASSMPTCRSSQRRRDDAVRRARARSSSCTAAAATSNSTWSTTAARCSGCNRAGAPNRS